MSDVVQREGIAGSSTNPGRMTDFPRWERESELDPRRTAPEQPDARDSSVVPQETVELDVDVDAWEDVDGSEDEDRRPPRLAAARESLGAMLAAARESLAAAGESLSRAGGRVGRWVASLDRRPEFDARRDPVAELTSGVDDGYVAELEAELAQLREAVDPPMSITEEIERLGEQTASILVVAHDKAHETARRAQEQAARAVTEASADAERITAQAQRRLCELDEETDAVWRERERLLGDVREVSRTLATLADAASERFPAADPAPESGLAPESAGTESASPATTVE
jgi:vacuolar-type H+-ATPase subunit E/Vma4